MTEKIEFVGSVLGTLGILYVLAVVLDKSAKPLTAAKSQEKTYWIIEGEAGKVL